MYACLDIGGSSIKVAVADKEGNLFSKDTLYVSHQLEEFTDAIVSWIEKMRSEYEIEGVAISAPGAVNTKTGIVGGGSAVPCIHGPNWKEVLGGRTGLPISIENDANCAALAEIFSGTAKDVNDMLFVVCGTGIGGAIVKDKKIHYGKHLYGGEFGFMILKFEDGEPISFSQCGSTMSFVKKVRKHYNDETWDGLRVFKAAEEGDKFCQDVIDTFYFNMALGIFNLQHVYDPEMILLGGSISDREDFIDRVNEKIEEIRNTTRDSATIKPDVRVCTHKKDANLVGALAHHLAEQN